MRKHRNEWNTIREGMSRGLLQMLTIVQKLGCGQLSVASTFTRSLAMSARCCFGVRRGLLLLSNDRMAQSLTS